ncbi:FtsX-like permease family protein [Plantactinospora sp. KLBMP9567]|uniref:FtsX-like permease family protein n=1 Tax=Plantactinospora sp. KLBMP9567 TaxID=3085900 RepID=UPI002980D5D5|nr:FtsX-like permease family protein [Plantactinospora sp. KLBMP9567]MDW5327840.1 ABC transporter permease [Plantactinospora sp. KLBMP9567]
MNAGPVNAGPVEAGPVEGQDAVHGRSVPRRAGGRLPGPLRRARIFAGYLGLLGVLGLVAALLVTGAPRLANEFADDGMRHDVRGLPYQVRDLTYTTSLNAVDGPDAAVAAERLDRYRQKLPGPLPSLVGQQWFAGRIGPKDLGVAGDAPSLRGSCRPELQLRGQTGVERELRVVEGRWPASRDGVEAALSREAAGILGLRVGTAVVLSGEGFNQGSVPVRIVGLYDPIDPAAPAWDAIRLAEVPCSDPAAGTTHRAALLTDLSGMTAAGGRLGLTYEWRYRVDEERVTTADIPEVLTAIAATRRTPPERGLVLATGLDNSLTRFDGQLRAVRALLAVVQAGILATLLGLVALAAGLAAQRRREEFTLLRARGAAAVEIGARTLRETVAVLPVAVLAGWLLGRLAPGRPAGPEPLGVALVAVGTTLAIPLLAMLSQRRASFVGRRRDLMRHRPSVRRLTAELFVLLLAVLGVVLLHRRGLSQDTGVDPYLVSVPVLLAVAAALVALRLVPWPLRQVGRIAARARTVVPFVGLARAGRGAPVTVGPLAVLVVAIATGVFTSVVTSTVAEARDRVTDQEIGAAARIVGSYSDQATADRIAALPGVRAVSPLAVGVGQPLRSPTPNLLGGRDLGQVQVLVVDGPSLARVLAASGVDVDVPAGLAAPGRIDGPVPALVSPEVAEAVGAGAVTEVQGRRYEFRVDRVASGFPGLAADVRRFVVLPWQALPVPQFQPIRPNQFLVAGDGFAAAELIATVDTAQREYLAEVLGQPVEQVRPQTAVTVTTWAQHREALERSGVNRLLSFTFGTGVAGATALALLAVGFAVLAQAPGRGRMLSRLRTMGLSGGQGRGLLVYELVPLLGVAVLAGGLVGVALPWLLGPALGLSGFTGGLPARIHLDPLLVVGVLLLVVVALVAALGVENLINRRMRLGEVLRLGEEN